MQINIIFHNIAEDNEELTNKYSVNRWYLIRLIEDIKSKLISMENRPELCLYFDDGYSSFYNVVLPMIDDIPFPITLTVILDKLDTAGYITTEQLINISNSRVSIASHGVSHAALAVYRENQLQDIALIGKYENTPFGQGEPLSADQIKYQFIESKKKLESIINKPIDEFVLPYGLYNSRVVEIFKELDLYKYLSTCDIGIDNGQILKPRFLISNDTQPAEACEKLLHLFTNYKNENSRENI